MFIRGPPINEGINVFARIRQLTTMLIASTSYSKSFLMLRSRGHRCIILRRELIILPVVWIISTRAPRLRPIVRTTDSFVMGSVLILLLGIICHASIVYALTVIVSGLDSDALYGRINNDHLPDVAYIAGFISVDKGTVLLSYVFKLYAFFVKVLSSVVQNKLIMISVHSPEFA